jgi:hypothetical protein
MAAADLPRVLAGPILRRCEQSGVWIWFALRMEPVGFEPRVIPYHRSGDYNAEYTGRGGSFDLAVPAATDLRTIPITPQAWVALVRLKPRGGARFPTDVLLGYTIRFTLKDAAGQQHRFWLHEEVEDIAYRPFELPTFFLSSRSRRIAQASCRRPGATGYDAHLAFDKLLADAASRIEERPYALILTGDQIYADDVAEALFESTRKLARDLAGYVEEVLVAAARTARAEAIPFEGRRDLVVKTLGFTTEDKGHLLTIAEYAAMYLLVWGPGVYAAYNPERRPDILGTHQGGDLVGFGLSVVAARRVLANIPTYMVFDDHEVTDDWYMDYDWVRGTSTPESRHVIANALFAYWIFQAWGNDPDGLEDMRSKVSIALRYRSVSKGKYHKEYQKAVDWILGRHRWSFVPPITPQTLVVDTRTGRQFPTYFPTVFKKTLGKRLSAPAILVGKDEIARLRKLAADARIRSGEVLLLVVATPLFLLPFVELGATINVLKGKSRYDDDHELFVDNIPARNYFLERVQAAVAPDSIVAFSGDVHHSFVIQAKLEFVYVDKKTRDVDVLQVTSSPIKNMNANFAGTKGVLADWGEEVLHDESVLEPELSIDGQSIAITEYKPLSLKGPLGHSTHIPNNNFCVVDFAKAPAAVDVIFVGLDGKNVAKATRSVTLKAPL